MIHTKRDRDCICIAFGSFVALHPSIHPSILPSLPSFRPSLSPALGANSSSTAPSLLLRRQWRQEGGGAGAGAARAVNTLYFWSPFRRTRAISLPPPPPPATADATSMPFEVRSFAHARPPRAFVFSSDRGHRGRHCIRLD